ncbi:hypothetical protein QBC43DRAFT_82475 [Cladorrhinum sp. PSN259]|nr:hypothetical protein QBC43DRAFT_82475 [Cladorrhinum sp. PSN259]
MGFIRRFAGGTILTAGITYYAISRTRQNPPPEPIIPQYRPRHSGIRPDGTYVPRDTLSDHASQFVENIKARWNQEILNVVRWAQGTDWDAVRTSTEDSAVQAAHFAKERGTELGHQGGEKLKEAEKWAKQAGKQAYDGAFELEKRALLELHELEKKAAEKAKTVKKTLKKSEEALAKKGKDVYGKAKAAVYLAEEKVESKVDAKLLGVGEMEKVLNERYDWKKREDRLDRSVEETLAERYIPADKREHRLRLL